MGSFFPTMLPVSVRPSLPFAALMAIAALAAACKPKAPEGSPRQAKPAGAAAPRQRPPLPGQRPRRPPITLPAAPAVPAAPLGLPPTPSPAHNPTTAPKVLLGRLLFFDPRLSANRSMSCASCHDPAKGWADGRRRDDTAAGVPDLRHTPTLINVGYAHAWFWDGSMPTLEAQILSTWKGQMGAVPERICARLARIPLYVAWFERAFDAAPTRDHVAEALAAFVRTIRSGNSPWDRYERGDHAAVSRAAVAGFDLFRGVAQCANCHAPPLYTDESYYNMGVGDPKQDPGRYRVTRDRADLGAFRTPTLRAVTLHPPYFHDGSAATLAQAVDRMLAARARVQPAGTPPPQPLTRRQKRQLLAFLRALTPRVKPMPRPRLPPDPPRDAGARDGGS